MATDSTNPRQRKANNDGSCKGDAPETQNTTPVSSTSNPWSCWSQFPAPPMSEQPASGQYKSFTEYADALRTWLAQYQMHQQMNQFNASMPYYTMGYIAGQQMAQQQTQQQPPVRPAAVVRPQPAQPARRRRVVRQDFVVPGIWKRVLAECIDFFLLFAMKLGITILVIEYVGIIDLKKYDIDFLFDTELDYNTAFTMTSELVALEVINRIFITLFETMCLRRGMAGQIGGATPGKRLLRLKVVSCTEVTERGLNRITVTPAHDLGFWNALVRSVIKNFSLAFFFPVCITAFFFQHNRAAYDIISNCIVVEDNQ